MVSSKKANLKKKMYVISVHTIMFRKAYTEDKKDNTLFNFIKDLEKDTKKILLS